MKLLTLPARVKRGSVYRSLKWYWDYAVPAFIYIYELETLRCHWKRLLTNHCLWSSLDKVAHYHFRFTVQKSPWSRARESFRKSGRPPGANALLPGRRKREGEIGIAKINERKREADVAWFSQERRDPPSESESWSWYLGRIILALHQHQAYLEEWRREKEKQKAR